MLSANISRISLFETAVAYPQYESADIGKHSILVVIIPKYLNVKNVYFINAKIYVFAMTG